MGKRVFVTRRIPDVGLKMLEDKGYTVEVYPKDAIVSQKELIRILKKGSYDAVLCLLTDTIDHMVFDSAPSVKLYSNYATGFDNIDVTEAKRRGIAVANAPASLSTETVAEHTIALMLALSTRIVEANEFVRRGNYKGWSPLHFIGTNVLGKTFGLIGAGRIGERVAHYAKGLGLTILYTDVSRNEKIEKEYGAVYCGSVEELLPKADVVSLHTPLLASTRHLINDARLRMMKPTSFIINTSRGPIIDEKALEKALRTKVIAGAGLDVFECEPKMSRGLRKLPNVILTPHIASASVEARDEMAMLVASNVISFFETGKATNAV